MDKLKILLYGDIDMNLIDGSSVWVTSIIKTLLINENIKIDYLLKRSITDKTVISSIENSQNLTIVNPFENMKFAGIRMQPDEAADYIEILDYDNEYDCIIVRGTLLCESVCKKEILRKKLIAYIIPEKNSKKIEYVGDKEKNRLKFIYENSRYIFCQTKESKELIIKLLSLQMDDKIIILPPMIQNSRKSRPDFINKKNELIYSGKFCESWYTDNILKACQKLIKEDSTIKLIVVGNKFHKDINDKKEEIINVLEKHPNINWIKGVSREDSNKYMENADIGIAWRSKLIDNDDSVELSTKTLEYARAGIPIILSRTKMYENLLGKDYPLFVEDNEEDFIRKVKLALYDQDIYFKAASSAYNSIQKYTYSQVYKSIHLKLWKFKKDKINLVFAGHDFKFINKVIDYCKNSNKFDVRIDEWKGHNKHDIENSKQCLEWADVIFCEWGLGNTKWYSNNKKEYQTLIVRMHSQELRTLYYKDFNLNNIDKIIAISPYIYEEFSYKINMPRDKMQVIYNYVDCSYFDKPKIDGCEYNLGIVGICPKTKRFDLAIDIFEKLWKEDKRYKLYVKGKHPKEYNWLMNREDEKSYYDKLFNRIENSPWKNKIIFDGYSKDLDEWYRKIGYVLSTSDFESFHLSPAEGMASGSIPIILNWDGSETIHQEKYICNSIEEAVNLINKYKYMIESKELKEYPKMNFGINKIFNEIECLLK